MRKKLFRITTVPISLDKLLEGQLKFMSNYYDITTISSDENGYLQKIANREGVDFKSIELTRSITPVKDLKSLWQMIQFLKKEKPLIIHTHTPKAGTIGMIAAKLTGVPIRLHTVAGLPLLESKGLKRKLLNLVEKITYLSATKVLPNSFGLKKIILKEGFCNDSKLHVIGKGSSNGINTDWFDPKQIDNDYKGKLKSKLGISKIDDFVFIFVGRIVKDKGIIELVNAYRELKNFKTKLILVGTFEHELDPLPKEVLSEIKNNPNIIHTGWQNDIRPYLAISDVLTFPSYREGFPNVVMQAGAMGLPSIVSDINGCNEIITENKNGIIVPVKNKEALQHAMIDLLTNKEKNSYLKSNARDIIKKKYNQNYIWQEIHKFYEKEISNL